MSVTNHRSRSFRRPARIALLVLFLAGAFLLYWSLTFWLPRDCWGGAFSQDPLHCYVLNEAQREGVIKIDAIYQVGQALHIYLDQEERVDEETVGDYFKEKATEFLDTWPDRMSYDHPDYHGCAEGGWYPWEPRSHEECLLEVLTIWKYRLILPPSLSYEYVQFRVGGGEARKKEPGWASYVQLWPQGEAGAGARTLDSDEFDVSEVDTTNFPEVLCWESINARSGQTCDPWELHPGLGIAGMVTATATSVDGFRKNYVQVKGDPEKDADRFREIHRQLVDFYPFIDEEELVIIPVKYDYEELWRWATILNRFASSSGNTLGIVAVQVSQNRAGAVPGEAVFPLPDLPEANYYAREDWRTTVRIITLHLERTVEALPRLLKQLDIPVDAVGLVIERVQRVNRSRRSLMGGAGEGSGIVAAGEGVVASGTPWLPIGLGTGLGAAVLAVALLLLVRRLGRRPSSST